jgi:hypothetical protein
MKAVENYYGWACINGKFVNKSAADMSNAELSDWIEQGAWRHGGGSDWNASVEAAKRLRTRKSWYQKLLHRVRAGELAKLKGEK